MAEDQSIHYLDLSLCTSSETEVNMPKKEPVLEFSSDGSIRISKKQKEATADTTGELRVRLCMQRRALAFQLANIATFTVLDGFISKLFALMTRKPISGYKSVTLQQVIAADQALWQLVAQETRGQVMTSGDPKPIDKAVKESMDSPEVSYHLLPMRDSHKGDGHDLKDKKEKKDKKRKNEQDPDKPPKNPKVDIPEGCTTKTDSNQNICFGYNRKSCMVRGAKV